MSKIVGLMMVKNEDRFVERAILNVLDFCDVMFVDDNNSSDETHNKVADLASRHPKIKLRRIEDTRQSNEHLEPLCNTRTWVFAVDGDELYDRAGLSEFRRSLLGGRYDEYWCIKGNMFHLVGLSDCETKGTGYLSPPAKTVTKLYNFRLINAFPVPNERLHGRPEFNARYSPEKDCLYLHQTVPWDEAVFRCAHMAFVPRSSKPDTTMTLFGRRMNPPMVHRLRKDWKQRGVLRAGPKLIWLLLQCFLQKDQRRAVYEKGPIVTRDVSVFTIVPAH